MGELRVHWSRVRDQLWTRCGGKCEVSGQQLNYYSFDAHHRRNKGMGGTSRDDRDALYNLLALDPVVHNGGPLSVHGRRDWSEVRGYLVPKHVERPDLWPVWLPYRRMWVLLSKKAEYIELPYPPPE